MAPFDKLSRRVGQGGFPCLKAWVSKGAKVPCQGFTEALAILEYDIGMRVCS